MITRLPRSPFFLFNDTATTEICTLSLHDALPIFLSANVLGASCGRVCPTEVLCEGACVVLDREGDAVKRSEEHTSKLQSQSNLVCRLLLEKQKTERCNRKPKPTRLNSFVQAILSC